MLAPTIKNDYERILLMGGAGSGKTTAWLNVAKWAKETRSDARFFVVDTDRTVPRMLAGQYEGVNVEVYPATDWDEYEEALTHIEGLAKPVDWVVIDMIGPAWDAVQSYYTEQVFQQDYGNFFLEARKANNERALEGWTDWKVINGLYKSWIKRLLFRGKFHVACCTPAEPVNRKLDSPAIVNLFGRFGAKPVGQKLLPYQFHTLLLTEQLADGKYVISTVKDREREQLIKAPITDFTDIYLMKVAHWTI